MGNWDWQTAAALICVAAAGVWLLRRTLSVVARPEQAGCGGGGCSQCPASQSAADAKPLITLDTSVSAGRSGSTQEAQVAASRSK